MASDIFLKLADTDGESKDSVHAGEIEVLSWDWGANQSGSMHDGTGGGSGKVNVANLNITKYADKSTPKLVKSCCTGQHFADALLTVRKAGGDEPVEYLKIKMTEVLIGHYQTGNASGDQLVESVGLNFADVEVIYTPQKEDGTADAEVTVGFNIRENVGR